MGQTPMIARKVKGCLPIENKSWKIENYNIKCLSIVLFDITHIWRTQDTKTKWVRMRMVEQFKRLKLPFFLCKWNCCWFSAKTTNLFASGFPLRRRWLKEALRRKRVLNLLSFWGCSISVLNSHLLLQFFLKWRWRLNGKNSWKR